MRLAVGKKVMGGILALSVLFMMSACGMNHNQPNDQESQAVATEQVDPNATQAPAETDAGSNTETPVKNTYTEEEKAFIESQEGVTVDDNGVINVDVSDMFE